MKDSSGMENINRIPKCGGLCFLVLVCFGFSWSCSTAPEQPKSIEGHQKKIDQKMVIVQETLRKKEETLLPSSPPPTVMNSSPEIMARGERVFQENCANCHGDGGNGKGEVANSLHPRPADFTTGVYKFRSTPSGQLPTDDDVIRSISQGIPGTAMDSYEVLSTADREALVTYIKGFSPRFSTDPPGTPLPPPLMTPSSQEGIARGRAVYGQMQCEACHGERGDGKGPLAEVLTDTAGVSIRPADLTQSRLKSGRGPESIFRTVITGLDGTPMPSFGDSLTPEEAWELALYVHSLSQGGTTP